MLQHRWEGVLNPPPSLESGPNVKPLPRASAWNVASSSGVSNVASLQNTLDSDAASLKRAIASGVGALDVAVAGSSIVPFAGTSDVAAAGSSIVPFAGTSNVAAVGSRRSTRKSKPVSVYSGSSFIATQPKEKVR